jgi:transcriptional regulator with XRE-family HTH domain
MPSNRRRRPKGITFEQSVALRVRRLRERHGLSQQDLADKLASYGIALDRSAVARLERGRRGISLEEAMYLALAIDVAPVHLIVDPDGELPIVIGKTSPPVAPFEARGWIRGEIPLYEQDIKIYLSEIPLEEFERRFQRRERDQVAPVEEERS